MDTPTSVVTVGTDLLAGAVEAQAVPVTRVDWRPPMPGTEDDLVAVATDPRRADANARALAAMLAVQATLVDAASSAASSCTPAHPSAGTAPPARCAGP